MTESTREVLGRSHGAYEREGLARDVQVWEDGARTSMGPGFYEWWYFDTHLSDGTSAVIIFFPKFHANVDKDLAPYVEIRITERNGTHHVGYSRHEAEQFSASREKCDVVCGHNRIYGDLHTYKLVAEAEGLAAELTFTRATPSWRPGTGKWELGDEGKYLAWVVPQPSAKVEGVLTFGGKSIEVTGTGYHDHNWGNCSMSELFNHWWWARTEAGGYTTIAAELTTTAAYGKTKLPVFMLADSEQVIADEEKNLRVDIDGLEEHPVSGKTIANRVVFGYQDEKVRTSVSYDRRRDLKIDDLLERLPEERRDLARRAGVKAWYHRFEGPAALSVNKGGEEEKSETTGIYELMHLGHDKI